MGLFKKRQDNYTLVADNIVAFYMILRDNFSKSFRKEQLMFAAGLMDVIIYLQNGSITPNEIARAVYLAKHGEIALKGRKLVHARRSEDGDMSDYAPTEEELLVNFTLQIECLIMSVKKRGNMGTVLLVVNKKKDLIRDTILNGLKEGKDHKFYAPLEEQAKEWFTERTMNKAVSGFKI